MLTHTYPRPFDGDIYWPTEENQWTGRVAKLYAVSVDVPHVMVRLDLYQRTYGHIPPVGDPDTVRTVTAKQDLVQELPAIKCKVRKSTTEQILDRLQDEEDKDDLWLLICLNLDLVKKEGFDVGSILPLTEGSLRRACQNFIQEPSDLLGEQIDSVVRILPNNSKVFKSRDVKLVLYRRWSWGTAIKRITFFVCSSFKSGLNYISSTLFK